MKTSQGDFYDPANKEAVRAWPKHFGHLGFLFTTYFVATNCCTYYGLCFFGVIESSSVVLTLVDFFHPKHKEYCSWLDTMPILKAVNDLMRGVFVLAYLAVRGFYFPYVSWARFTPDMLTLQKLPLAQRQNITDVQLYIPFVLVTLFSFLQLHWGVLLIKQLRKMLNEAPNKKD